jgi:hypothetical protein
MALEIIEAAEEVINEAFPPRPGGLVDRYRRKAALEEARREEEKNTAESIEQPAYRAVKVAQQQPEIYQAITYTIPAGGYAPVLPASPYRHSANLLVITSGATVILAKDSGNAISGSGFTLPYGIVKPMTTRAQVYAYNNTSGIVQVSADANLYAPEQPR